MFLQEDDLALTSVSPTEGEALLKPDIIRSRRKRKRKPNSSKSQQKRFRDELNKIYGTTTKKSFFSSNHSDRVCSTHSYLPKTAQQMNLDLFPVRQQAAHLSLTSQRRSKVKPINMTLLAERRLASSLAPAHNEFSSLEQLDPDAFKLADKVNEKILGTSHWLTQTQIKVPMASHQRKKPSQSSTLRQTYLNSTSSMSHDFSRQSSKFKFVFDSEDDHFRSILLKSQWIELSTGSSSFDLKWSYKQNLTEYQKVAASPHQHYNHIKGNRLTTKDGLLGLFYGMTEDFQRPNLFMPRRYQIPEENISFLRDFNDTFCLSLLKQLIPAFQQAFPLFDRKKSFPLNSDVPVRILSLYQAYLRIDKSDFKGFSSSSQGLYVVWPRLWIVLSHCIRILSEIGALELDEDLQRIMEPIPNISSLLDSSFQDLLGKQGNQDCILLNEQIYELLYCLHTQFKYLLPHYTSDGVRNYWIMKPEKGSKGYGIELIVSYQQLKKRLDQHNQYSRIVEKYIECPLIFTGEHHPIKRKKFDIRQWVLITAENFYIFSQFYLRVCSRDYDLNDSELCAHITNYSVNKTHFLKQNACQDSVVSQQQFEKLCTLSGRKREFQQLKASINEVVAKIVEFAHSEMEHHSRCFQLVGFDLLVDTEFKPWVLEVNMSPACAARTPWLTNLAYRMAYCTLRIIFNDKIPEQSDMELDDEIGWIKWNPPKPKAVFINNEVLKIQGKAIGKPHVKRSKIPLKDAAVHKQLLTSKETIIPKTDLSVPETKQFLHL